MKNVLVFGYGNPYRQDDGVAWHVLIMLAKRLWAGAPGWRAPTSLEEEFIPPTVSSYDLKFDIQLTPELAELIAGYQRVCFIDAHTGNIPEEIRMVEVKSENGIEALHHHSPFTHHTTPAACLSMAQTIYGGNPQTMLVTVRGYEFGFAENLSPRTQALAEQAAAMIYAWLVGETR